MSIRKIGWFMIAMGCGSEEPASDDPFSEETPSDDTSAATDTSSEDTSVTVDTASEDTSSEDTALEDTSSEDTSSPDSYSLEDRWVVPGLNTMYEFDGHIRRTYYCMNDSGSCDDDDWSAMTLSDAIPGEHVYTFDGVTLTIDLNYGNYFVETVLFECDGGIIEFDITPGYWRRLGVDLDDCGK